MPEFDDSAWASPEYLGKPHFPELNSFDPSSRWRLEESAVPEMMAEPVAIKEARSTTVADSSLRNGVLHAKVPAGKHKLHLDLGRYYTHLPHLKSHGGAGNVFIRYAECLLTGNMQKGRRDFLENAVFPPESSCDEVVFAGGDCSFTPAQNAKPERNSCFISAAETEKTNILTSERSGQNFNSMFPHGQKNKMFAESGMIIPTIVAQPNVKLWFDDACVTIGPHR